MKTTNLKLILIIAITLLISINTLEAQNLPKKTSVTVYNENLGVIKETREISLKKGINYVNIQDVAEQIDPTSVFIKLPAKVLEQNYQYDLVNIYKILDKYIDKEINVNLDGQVIKGKLLSASGNKLVLQRAEGGLVMLSDMQKAQIYVPDLPEDLITRPTLVWTIEADKTANQTAELSYQTSGMSWTAEYVAELNDDDSKMDINAWVTIKNNSGATYKDAQLKLIAGEVNRIKDEFVYMPRMAKMSMETQGAYNDGFTEEEFFEYHLYDLDRQTTIKNNEDKQISLFTAKSVPVKKTYTVRPPSINSFSQSNKTEVNVSVEFKNSKENNLGLPFPKGRIRMNKSTGKTLEFIGEDRIEHTPKDENIKVKIGKAFDVVLTSRTVERKQIAEKIEEVEVEYYLRNRKSKEDIEVDFECPVGFYNTWEILALDYKWTQKNANTIIFKVPIKKEQELKFRIKARFISR